MISQGSIERFHLEFLRHFASTLSPGIVCPKGAVNRIKEQVRVDLSAALLSSG